MTNKLALSIIIIAMIMTVSIVVEITDSVSTQGNVTIEKKHSLLFESSYSTYPAFLNITAAQGNESDMIGFDVSDNEIDFGSIPAGGSISRKHIYITNPTTTRGRVIIVKTGLLSEMLNISESNFVLMPGEKRNVTLSANSGIHEPGFYSGNVIIIFKKPTAGILDFLT